MEKKIFCSALMPLSLMENPEERCENCREYYPAADVDAERASMLAAVRRIVDAARRSYESMYAMNERTHPMDFSKKLIQMHNLLTSADELENAIAAVERHLLKE